MNNIDLLTPGDCVLVIIDIQEKLLKAMYHPSTLLDNLKRLVQGSKVFQIPIIMTEQYPQGLGPTVPEILNLLPEIKPIPKRSFSCCQVSEFENCLKETGKKEILLAGIEAHVCVYQTAIELLKVGYNVHVVTDCISSRNLENCNLAIQKMHDSGARLTTTEMLLFELLKIAEGEKFKAISQIIK